MKAIESSEILVNCLRNHVLIPYSRVLLENTIGSQLTVFIAYCHWFLSQAK